jgi:hypothetical protein
MITIHKNAMIFRSGFNGAPACFLGGKSQSSKTSQSAANSQTGVQGGDGTSGVGSGTAGAVGTNGGLAINLNQTKAKSSVAKGGAGSPLASINVTSNSTYDTVTNSDADAPAFLSVIDHLVTAVTTPPETPQTSQSLASNEASSGSPTISSGIVPEQSSAGGFAPSNNVVNWVIIGGGILTVIVFLKSRGKSA